MSQPENWDAIEALACEVFSTWHSRRHSPLAWNGCADWVKEDARRVAAYVLEHYVPRGGERPGSEIDRDGLRAGPVILGRTGDSTQDRLAELERIQRNTSDSIVRLMGAEHARTLEVATASALAQETARAHELLRTQAAAAVDKLTHDLAQLTRLVDAVAAHVGVQRTVVPVPVPVPPKADS